MNSNPVRLGRYAYLDHVTSEERLLFTRKPKWKSRLFWYPVVFFSVWVLWAMAKPAFGETFWGKADGEAYVVTRFDSGPLIEFTVRLKERR